MGVMTREQGGLFVITSDRGVEDAPTKMAPKRRSETILRVWTGSCWSTDSTTAMTFATAEAADDYTKDNLARVMDGGGTTP
jgi:hypothetical protein